ncbi:class I SAM-dependent methyltransferase [Victivallis vadensis]|uniref:Class I SAM-dependent methyltransferase n=1 Tax=Victivallis vadensis TaxID=172901 RepID=A0A848ATW3_9BACT|nr:class I SAM-dependent methyltransferase [Victivallis vadensis]NMD85673.1 class I SAM-dependent methyltransferase [Victivallis vadensis]
MNRSNKKSNPSSQAIGLRIANICGRYLLHTDHLHYGFWPEDLPVSLENLPRAQDLYSQFLCDHLPEGVTTILDVGCGTGHNAELLLERGYQVDCVSPSPYLSEVTESKLKGRGHLYNCIFEELPEGKKYDMLLFSESFQYIQLDGIFERFKKYLNPGGAVMIADFFRIESNSGRKSAMGGGHRLSRFRERLAEAGEFRQIEEIDITENTAPNMQLVDETLQQVAVPIRDMVLDEFSSNYKLLYTPTRWLAKLFFRKKLEKLEYKYFSGARNPENFKEHKRYMFFLLRHIPA